jgi:molybdate transport system permease protein
MFAGSFQGRTQTLPLAIYGQFSSGNVDGALAMAGFLVAVSVCLLVVVKAVLRGRRAEEPSRWMVLSRSTSRTG